MPFYNDLRPDVDFEYRDFAQVFPSMSTTEKLRAIDGVLALKDGISHVRPRRCEENLIVASWNIKEFGHTTQRLPESFFYLAEIISRFDHVAVQEVNSGLDDLDRLLRILGSRWDYLVNDITDGQDGNAERSAFLFNTERVRLGGLEGELVQWRELLDRPELDVGIDRLKRTPYITGFQAGWKKFAVVTLHLEPGTGTESAEMRRDEITLLLAMLRHKLDTDRLWNDNIIITGDFNFYDGPGTADWRDIDRATVAAIHDAGFTELDALDGVDTNASETEAYDRFFIRRGPYFMPETDDPVAAGVINPFDHVLTDDEVDRYADEMRADYTGSSLDLDDPGDLRSYLRNPWRKNQISDHFPIWFEMGIDSSAAFLESRRAPLEAQLAAET